MNESSEIPPKRQNCEATGTNDSSSLVHVHSSVHFKPEMKQVWGFHIAFRNSSSTNHLENSVSTTISSTKNAEGNPFNAVNVEKLYHKKSQFDRCTNRCHSDVRCSAIPFQILKFPSLTKRENTEVVGKIKQVPNFLRYHKSCQSIDGDSVAYIVDLQDMKNVECSISS